MGRSETTGRFVPLDVAKANPDRYEIVSIPLEDPRIIELRRLIYEPEHTEAPCWCNPSFIKKGDDEKLHIIHNEQRDEITAFVKMHFK